MGESDIAEILKLPVEERLRLIETIWDSISADPSSVPLTEAQLEELDRRLDDLERDGPTGLPAEEVLAKLDRRGV
jgi:putative addiction module component (TIGR02574 family)